MELGPDLRGKNVNTVLPSVIMANVCLLRHKTDSYKQTLTTCMNKGLPPFLDLRRRGWKRLTVMTCCTLMASMWVFILTCAGARQSSSERNCKTLTCPLYLPSEFPHLFFILVYIHPRANASTAIDHMKNSYPLTLPNSSWETSTTTLLTSHWGDFINMSPAPPLREDSG